MDRSWDRVRQLWRRRQLEAAHDGASGVIAPERIQTVAALPYRLHTDHPESIELWPEAGPGGVLVIYDAPAPERTGPAAFTVRADLIDLRRPKASSRAKRVAAVAI